MLFFGGVRPTTARDYLHQLPFFVVTAAAAGVAGTGVSHPFAFKPTRVRRLELRGLTKVLSRFLFLNGCEFR